MLEQSHKQSTNIEWWKQKIKKQFSCFDFVCLYLRFHFPIKVNYAYFVKSTSLMGDFFFYLCKRAVRIRDENGVMEKWEEEQKKITTIFRIYDSMTFHCLSIKCIQSVGYQSGTGHTISEKKRLKRRYK